MPWIVGIDEAGYGPNLGPFVMSAVACRVPGPWRAADLWKVFKKAARRHNEPPGSRFVVADSKLVYSPGKGLLELERSVHAVCHASYSTIQDFVDLLCPQYHAALCREVWYTGRTPVPVNAELDACASGRQALAGLCSGLDVRWGPVRSVVTCPSAFNAMLDRWGSKGAVLALALDPSNSATLYAGTGGGGVFKTINGAASWAERADNRSLASFLPSRA